MGILGIFKAANAVMKAEKFIEKHEDEKRKIEALIEKVKGALTFYQSHQDNVQTILAQLKEFSGK